MATDISAVTGNIVVSHAQFVSLELGANTYYLSSAHKPYTIGGNEYTNLGSFISISDIAENFKSTQSDITISISGIPEGDDNFLALFLTDRIKGGEVTVKRGFFNTTTDELITTEVYGRYQGIISNYGVEENTGFFEGVRTHTIVLSCVSIDTILENTISGQRTSGTSRRKYYASDISFDRVAFIQNNSLTFDR